MVGKTILKVSLVSSGGSRGGRWCTGPGARGSVRTPRRGHTPGGPPGAGAAAAPCGTASPHAAGTEARSCSLHTRAQPRPQAWRQGWQALEIHAFNVIVDVDNKSVVKILTDQRLQGGEQHTVCTF